jgi:hypothetical protein
MEFLSYTTLPSQGSVEKMPDPFNWCQAHLFKMKEIDPEECGQLQQQEPA